MPNLTKFQKYPVFKAIYYRGDPHSQSIQEVTSVTIDHFDETGIAPPGNPREFFFPEGYCSLKEPAPSRIFPFLIGNSSSDRWTAVSLVVFCPHTVSARPSTAGGDYHAFDHHQHQHQYQHHHQYHHHHQYQHGDVQGDGDENENDETKQTSYTRSASSSNLILSASFSDLPLSHPTPPSFFASYSQSSSVVYIPEGIVLLSPFNNIHKLHDRLLRFLTDDYDLFRGSSPEDQTHLLRSLLCQDLASFDRRRFSAAMIYAGDSPYCSPEPVLPSFPSHPGHPGHPGHHRRFSANRIPGGEDRNGKSGVSFHDVLNGLLREEVARQDLPEDPLGLSLSLDTSPLVDASSRTPELPELSERFEDPQSLPPPPPPPTTTTTTIPLPPFPSRGVMPSMSPRMPNKPAHSPLRVLLSTLSLRNILLIQRLLLLEHSVLCVSSQYSLLTLAMEGLKECM